MKKLKVCLKTDPYDIIFSAKERNFTLSFKRAVKTKSVFVVTDKNVARLYLPPFLQMLKHSGYLCESAVIEAGEEGKSMKSLGFLYDKALSCGFDRKSCVIALGGGVVGDVAGFFAATYMRGVKYAQVPTTLLSMSDSSVGGKTAVNTSGGKNTAGVFYQPSLVWINSSYLQTLAPRHMRNGTAEAVKYALIFDRKFYDYLYGLFLNGVVSSADFEYIAYKSCGYKKAIVEKDEKETKGLREKLNFGHTLAHALETYTGYKTFLHGEAVAAGMLFAADLSYGLNFCSKEVYAATAAILREAGFSFDLSGINAGRLVSLMTRDKKSVDGKVRFVILKDIGKAESGIIIEKKILKKRLEAFIKANRGKFSLK